MDITVNLHPRFPAIYWIALENSAPFLATLNLTPTKNVYNERLVRSKGNEYRLWNPYRSKLAAAILNGLKTVTIKPHHKVLYLGAASGTTASHISDIVGMRGHVYCIEFASRVIRELVTNVCSLRFNMSPIMADARLPERYLDRVEKVDDLYCDIAQPEQAKIAADNANFYLKDDGLIMLVVKAQSIDVTKDPSEIFEQEIALLTSRGFQVKEVIHLEPYDKAHLLIIAKKENTH